MSRCFKRYDVKHLRQSGCVPATREIADGVEFRDFCSASLLKNHANSQR